MYLVRSDARTCEGLGYPQLGHIPTIWTKDWEPDLESIDYLIARGTGRWVDREIVKDYRKLKPLAVKSVLALGYDLASFAEWREECGLTLAQAIHCEVPGRYCEDMQSGRWSRRNVRTALSESTIKRRVRVCSDFFSFLTTCCGMEEVDRIRFRLVSSPSVVSRDASGGQRKRPVRQHPSKLRLPTLDETRLWLQHIRQALGVIAYLMCKMIVGVGLRADEVIHFRESQLPALPTDGRKEVKMHICYGTKGKRVPQDPSNHGKARIVHIPTDLLVELHSFRDTQRKLYLRQANSRHPDRPAPKELFFSKRTGNKFSYKRLYEIWKSGPIPYSAFSPHIGRHMWACYTLIEKSREELEIIMNSPIRDHAAIDYLVANMVRIWIVKQLGHVDQKTTEMYLEWIREVDDLTKYKDAWWDYLNG